MNSDKQFRFLSVKNGLIAMLVAPVLAVLPLLAGLTLARLFCGPDANEANCGWGVLPWFTFFTAPAGFVLFVTGFVVLIISLVKKVTKKNDGQSTPRI
jgi:hypothetical protein